MLRKLKDWLLRRRVRAIAAPPAPVPTPAPRKVRAPLPPPEARVRQRVPTADEMAAARRAQVTPPVIRPAPRRKTEAQIAEENEWIEARRRAALRLQGHSPPLSEDVRRRQWADTRPPYSRRADDTSANDDDTSASFAWLAVESAAAPEPAPAPEPDRFSSGGGGDFGGGGASGSWDSGSCSSDTSSNDTSSSSSCDSSSSSGDY